MRRHMGIVMILFVSSSIIRDFPDAHHALWMNLKYRHSCVTVLNHVYRNCLEEYLCCLPLKLSFTILGYYSIEVLSNALRTETYSTRA